MEGFFANELSLKRRLEKVIWENRVMLKDGHALLINYSKIPQASDPARLNNFVRRFAKRLPGCAWSVDRDKLNVQIHVADAAEFLSFPLREGA